MIEHGADIQWPKQSVRVNVLGEMLSQGLPQIQGRGFAEVAETVGLMAWLHRDALIAAIDAEIDAVADDEHALTDADRAMKTKQLSDQLLTTERAECDLVAVTRGQIDYSDNVDPRALLGLSSDMPAPRGAILTDSEVAS